MKLKKFTATNTREALAKLRAELGEDAIILSTKQTAAGTEVLAASSADLDQVTEKSNEPPSWRRADREQLQQRQATAREMDSREMRETRAPVRHALPVAAQAYTAPAATPAPAYQAPAVNFQSTRYSTESAMDQFAAPSTVDMLSEVAHRRTMAAQDAMVHEQTAVLNEIKQMRQMLKDQMSVIAWRDSLDKNPQRAELWNLLTNAGFSALFARTLVEKLPEGLTESQMQEWASSVIKRNLSVMPASKDMVEVGGAYALVGPTGVGKTTTTAKLAARCVVKYGADSLGLITTDSYRIGAQDQLRIYGKILGVQVYTAQNEADLMQLRNSMQRKRLILIDTVGMGQRDARVGEQTRMLRDSNIKRVLLLNGTAQPETLDDVVRHYKHDGLAGAILSKLDEAIKIGGVLDVVMRHKLSLFYIATGQRVPEDLYQADPKVLVHRALKPRSAQAFQASSEELKWKMTQVCATNI